jgi:hypothetical protein
MILNLLQLLILVLELSQLWEVTWDKMPTNSENFNFLSFKANLLIENDFRYLIMNSYKPSQV